MVNPRTLQFIEGSEFNTMMQPVDLHDETYAEEHKDTIAWHGGVRKCTSDDILKLWKGAPLQKDAFGDFKEYLLRYHTRGKNQNKFSAPIKAGYNIIRFDNVIMERLCEKYNEMDRGDMKLFHPRDQLDGMMMAYNWFENMEEPKSYSMDSLREFFGMSKDGAHDALQDVRDTGQIITRFMNLHRRFAEKVKFKGSFKNSVK